MTERTVCRFGGLVGEYSTSTSIRFAIIGTVESWKEHHSIHFHSSSIMHRLNWCCCLSKREPVFIRRHGRQTNTGWKPSMNVRARMQALSFPHCITWLLVLRSFIHLVVVSLDSAIAFIWKILSNQQKGKIEERSSGIDFAILYKTRSNCFRRIM